MAFDPKEFIKSYKQKSSGGFDPDEFINKYKQQSGNFAVQQLGKTDTGNSSGLYNLAVKSGYQKEADRILSQKGEDSKKIFGGGFISDVFDVLNTLDYGVVGMLKGKSFSEGVKNRESFTKQDSLGKYGLVGTIGGTILDIAVDPLTYVSPLTIAKKIPALNKGITAVSKAAESSKVGKFLGEKFTFLFGAPEYKDMYNKWVRNSVVGDMNIVKLLQGIIDLPAEKTAKLLTKDATGRMIRKPLEELSKELTEDELFKVAKSYSILDDLGKQAVELGLLDKGTWEKNVGAYLKSTYEKYEKKEGTGLFGSIANKIKGIKSRKDLTPEQMAELGQIKNPAYLLFKSMIDLNHDIETAKLFKATAETFGSDIAKEGFEKMPSTLSYSFTTSAKIGIKNQIKNINDTIKPALKELKGTFKADKKILSEIYNLEKELDKLGGMRKEELYKFFNAGQATSKVSTIARQIGTIPDNLVSVAEKIKNYDSYEKFFDSRVGIEVEKLFEEGVLERSGFKSIKDFYESAIGKYVPETSKVVEGVAEGDVNKLISIQKQIEKLTPKLKNLKEIDKRSINDSFRYLEDIISKGNIKKEDLIDEIGALKMSDLAGKYVPKPIWNYLNDIQVAKTDSEKLLSKVVGEFKFNKVVLNPATHARNTISNMILNWWKLGVNPITNAGDYAEAAAEIAKGSGKWLDEAKTVGYGLDSFATNELRDSLLNGEVKGLGKAVKKTRDWLGNIYQGEENFAKLTAFINQRKKGLNIEDAWKAAESATFNYAQVTPFVRKLRQSIWGFPFITFTIKSTPVVAETMLKNPARVSAIGKIKNSIENLADIKETEKERANEPAWIRNGFYIKLPMKDENGRSAYFDLTYIIPFGDLVSGQFLEGQISRETGIEEGVGQSALRKNPTINFIREIARNEDFYGDKIWQDSDSQEQQLGDLFRHLTKTYTPPLVADQLPGGWVQQGDAKGTRRQKGFSEVLTPEQEATQKRTLMEEMLKQVGMKIQPINTDIQETYMEWEKKKALSTLLKEKGILDEFNKTYIPKD